MTINEATGTLIDINNLIHNLGNFYAIGIKEHIVNLQGSFEKNIELYSKYAGWKESISKNLDNKPVDKYHTKTIDNVIICLVERIYKEEEPEPVDDLDVIGERYG